ncbi:rRNA cytosine-C5-methyltransferase [Yinghuangia sp. ASG 101]|uniref:RsmB/NOP family class I SAM-dependent RNA methyltransferase n=1 Tax=Yinghuangia sp. ASG 101 TaxID=2896848 RepID=UPI001E35A341|nr:transcription antitermination factor NusB [Yinghuangia sp. ASG 101]UGQ13049.1 rRNA cytosine-C5-methyltransferase [Yinghuangia sp. ASG 101]
MTRSAHQGRTDRAAAPGKAGRTYRRPKPDAARRAAFDVLSLVGERDAYANLVLPGLLRDRRMTGRDAALATELVHGTLRRQGTYDAILDRCVDRPIGDVDPPVLDVLCLGAHQLLSTRIPSHAAVSATVELARGVLGDGRAKFVNAVLRKVAARDLEAWLAEVAPPYDDDPEGHLSVVHSHPRWVVEALWDALGGGRDGIEALLAADNTPPAVTLVARPGRVTLDELYAAGAAPGRWSPLAAVLPEGDPGAIPAVRDGRAGVQDEGSQLVAQALAAAPLGGAAGEARWLDLCAGPGGKAGLLGAIATERDVSLLAVERRHHRARLVRNALGRRSRHQVVTGDGTRPFWTPGVFDRVIADVPCSGLGALRRRPEARWRRRPEDIGELGPLQRRLLTSALGAVRPGGVVAYVTCSPHRAETRAVVDDVLATGAGSGFTRLDARAHLPGVTDLGDGPDVQLWPHLHGTDAMYLALLRRDG